MKNLKTILTVFITLGSFFTIAIPSLAQYSSSFQGAKSVGKGNAEMTAFYSNIGYAFDGEREKLFNNFGFQTGLGIGNLTEIRIRYDRFNIQDSNGTGLNGLMFGPKVSTESGKFALFLPIGFNFGEDVENNWMADPTLLFSLPLGQKVNLNLTPSYMFSLEKGGGLDDGILKLNLGLGVNLGDNWVIRPEGGIHYYVADFDGNFYNFGLGISRRIIKTN